MIPGRKGKAYIAGPMSNQPSFNFPAFFEAEHRLREMGWEVVNPAQMDYDLGFDPDTDEPQSHEAYMKRDLPELAKCDAIALLPEWWTSKGAKNELAVAQMCGLRVIDTFNGLPMDDWAEVATPENCIADCGCAGGQPADTCEFEPSCPRCGPSPESPLLEALRIVHTDRGADYGSPLEDFTRTGRMWGAILDLEDDVEPREVALCMAALKLSREAHQHKRDSLVDVAGYIETLAMIEGEAS
jgi:Domain of unknown function (DUF4406)/Domain of unknown function (DUF6378)